MTLSPQHPLYAPIYTGGIISVMPPACLLPASCSIPIPLGWLSPVGYVDTPYLDDELRISRGDKGSLFVAARVPPE